MATSSDKGMDPGFRRGDEWANLSLAPELTLLDLVPPLDMGGLQGGLLCHVPRPP